VPGWSASQRSTDLRVHVVQSLQVLLSLCMLPPVASASTACAVGSNCRACCLRRGRARNRAQLCVPQSPFPSWSESRAMPGQQAGGGLQTHRQWQRGEARGACMLPYT